LGLPPEKLFSTVFEGGDGVEKDAKSIELWQQEFKKIGIDAKVGEKIFTYGATKNWWSRAGIPSNMPVGEPGGPDTEVFFDYGEDLKIHEGSDFKEEKCHVNCDCGRYIEICNSVFMQYKKQEDGSLQPLPKPNVDFGGGLERLLMASEEKQDIFQTSLFLPIISAIEELTSKEYFTNKKEMRIVSDHFIASVFISSNGVKPSNKEQGYILRRLIRRGLDNFYLLSGKDISPILEKIVEQYSLTDPILIEQFVEIKNTILEEEQMYQRALSGGKKLIEKELSRAKDQVTVGDELMGVTLITAELAFKSMASYGLGPTQLKSLGYTFDDKELADLIKKHQENSRAGAQQKFAGGLADHSELTVKGHTATHLMHQALRDVLGDSVHQTGSNITSERVRFDFVYDKKVSSEELQKVKEIVDEKIKDDLPVHFEIMPLKNARELGAIGLFDDKYAKDVKIYFIGGSNPYSEKEKAYSIEFCGGPHVEHTGLIKSFDILKEEGVARGVRRLYVKVS
jgi:alanyl-tRNA synthetase